MVDVAIRKTVDGRPLKLVLSAQPLTKPSVGVVFDNPIGFADWAEAEVVSPSGHHPVERFHDLFRLQWSFVCPVSALIAAQIRMTRFFDGTVPR